MKLLAISSVAICMLIAHAPAWAATMSRDQIISEGEKMADAQLAVLSKQKPNLDWVPAVFWAGLSDFSHISSKPAYPDAIRKLGDSTNWTPLIRPKFPNHADDLCICQTFLDACVASSDAARLAPTQKRLDAVSDYILHNEPPPDPAAKGNQLTWWWCDALFMAPPSHARLSAITGDRKYIDAMDEEWWRTAGLLYDKDEHLFFRDKSFFGKKSRNGSKVFWTRANGWVFAGLARTLTYIPADYPSRPRYVTIFQQMAAKLASLQQPDGTWRPSLLDPAQFPDSESSGTALDCFAFTWGINNGLLDRSTYLPVATRAWAALLVARRPDGLLGYVQGVAAAPAPVKAEGTQPYATGGFLMSAFELSKLAPITLPPPPSLSVVPSPPPAQPAKSPSASP